MNIAFTISGASADDDIPVSVGGDTDADVVELSVGDDFDVCMTQEEAAQLIRALALASGLDVTLAVQQ